MSRKNYVCEWLFGYLAFWLMYNTFPFYPKKHGRSWVLKFQFSSSWVNFFYWPALTQVEENRNFKNQNISVFFGESLMYINQNARSQRNQSWTHFCCKIDWILIKHMISISHIICHREIKSGRQVCDWLKSNSGKLRTGSGNQTFFLLNADSHILFDCIQRIFFFFFASTSDIFSNLSLVSKSLSEQVVALREKYLLLPITRIVNF